MLVHADLTLDTAFADLYIAVLLFKSNCCIMLQTTGAYINIMCILFLFSKYIGFAIARPLVQIAFFEPLVNGIVWPDFDKSPCVGFFHTVMPICSLQTLPPAAGFYVHEFRIRRDKGREIQPELQAAGVLSLRVNGAKNIQGSSAACGNTLFD